MTELVIFDCDGVLVDSERISCRIQAEELTKLGWPMSTEECAELFLGLGMASSMRFIEDRLGPVPEGWEAAMERRKAEAFEAELTPVPGVVEALDAIALPTCVASSGSHAKMEHTLGLTGLRERFEGRIFSADEVEHGKPAPDLFLHAAATLGARPERCVVVEDSPFGVRAAHAAGMRVLGYAAMTPADRLPTHTFADMRGLPALLQAVSR